MKYSVKEKKLNVKLINFEKKIVYLYEKKKKKEKINF